MHKPLFLFVGKSASGKTTIANLLEEKYQYKQVESYTTRQPRFKGEQGHIFVNNDEFHKLNNIVAYTFYNGNHYGTTSEQLDQCDIYVVDVPGVKTLLEKYKANRPIAIIYFDTTVYTRINRMIDRGDSDMAIISRLLEDEKDDWFKQLDQLVWHYNRILGKDVELHSVNANCNIESAMEIILYYINQYTGD